MAIALPERLGPYRLTTPLGEGGMGIVYRAEHVETGEVVAVKMARVPYGSEMAGLRCEVHALTRIRHRGIVGIIAEGLDNGMPWYAMELLEGRTLADHHRTLWMGPDALARTESVDRSWDTPTQLNEASAGTSSLPDGGSGTLSASERHPGETLDLSAPLPPSPRPGRDGPPLRALDAPRVAAAAGKLPEALDLMRRLCAPLSFLHGAGIVHRDLKPSNVFIRADGSPVLMDFGLVSRFSSASGREVIDVADHIAGTAIYMSPEQILGNLVDARSDLYALGVMLYELVTGRVPFPGDSVARVIVQHISKAPTPPSELVDGLPPELEALILRLLAKEPRGRLGHADDVAAILGALSGMEPTSDRGAPASAYLYRPEIVGRKAVLQQLASHVADAVTGRGRAELIGGESGVGKTCLAAAVARDAVVRGMRVVTGECVPVATSEGGGSEVRGAPLHPFRRLFDAIADRCRERGRDATDRLLGPRGRVLAAYEPHLRLLPGQDAYPEMPEVPAPAARRRVLLALADTLAAFVDEQPVLLILDDLQWADELSLGFLGSLDASYFELRPLMILGTYRSEEMNEGLREVLASPSVGRTDLGRLDEETVGLIVAGMLAMSAPPPSLVRVLARRSAGNPFFVAEYLRTAVAEGLLYRERGAWRVAEGAEATEAVYEALPLPGSLRELVGRRLDGIGEGARALAEVAAVLGREVDGEILVAVAGVDQDTALGAVKELLGRQVLEEQSPGRFRFVHDKLREIAYERVPEARRRALHGKAALTIEARHAESSGFSLMYSELAHHFTAAGEVMKAIDYLEKAAQQAERDFANREAARFLTEALLLDEKAGFQVTTLRRAAWERQLGDAYLGLGTLVESQQHLHRAVALLGVPMPGPMWRLILGFLAQVVTQLVHRLRPPRWAERPPDQRAVLLEAARGYDRLVPVTYYVTGELPRILFATLSNLNLAELAGPSPELALAYGNSHLTVGLIPWSSLARTYGEKAHETLRGVTDPAVRSWVYVLAGGYACGVGAWDTAFDLGERALAIAEEVRFSRRIEEAQGVLGSAYCLHGDFEKARDISQRTFESGQRGDPQTQVWGLSGVAQACLCLDELERALVTAELSEKRLSQKLGRPEKIIAYGVLALTRLRCGDRSGALATAEQGLASIIEGAPISFYCINAYSCVAEVFLDLWEQSAGPPGDRQALAKKARRACKEVSASAKIFAAHRARAHYLWGRWEAIAGRAPRARRHWERAIEAARALDLAYEEGLAELALATQLDPADPERASRLGRAEALFREKNAVHDLDRVKRARAALAPA